MSGSAVSASCPGPSLRPRVRTRPPRTAPAPPSPEAASGAWRRPSTRSRGSSPRRRVTRAGRSRVRRTNRSPRGKQGTPRSSRSRLRSTGKVAYERLLEVFWRNIDPFDGGGQFCDRGSQYRSTIFYEGDDQKRAALRIPREPEGVQANCLPPIVTKISTFFEAFYQAEENHQDYYLRNIRQYWSYRSGCGPRAPPAPRAGGRGQPVIEARDCARAPLTPRSTSARSQGMRHISATP